MFILLSCWYEGDSELVSDSFLACSESVKALVTVASYLAEGKPYELFLPGHEVPDNGQYGDYRTRYRIVEAVGMIEGNVLVFVEADLISSVNSFIG